MRNKQCQLIEKDIKMCFQLLCDKKSKQVTYELGSFLFLHQATNS